jgi:hypothetical protein
LNPETVIILCDRGESCFLRFWLIIFGIPFPGAARRAGLSTAMSARFTPNRGRLP